MYIADVYNNRIRKVTVSTGIITTIAGSSTSTGYSGDNGAATSATFNIPRGVALDASGTTTICEKVFFLLFLLLPTFLCFFYLCPI